MIPLNTHQLPAAGAKLTNQDGTATKEFYYLLQTLMQRGGGNSGVPSTVNTYEAAGASQATATAFVDDVNHVTAGAGGGTLHPLQPGQAQTVFNDTGGNINVYPAEGGQINALGFNTPHVLANGKSQVYTAVAVVGGGTQYKTANF